MKTMSTWLFACLSLLLVACAAGRGVAYDRAPTEPIKNERGDVVGRVELSRNPATGEEVEKFVYYVPRLDTNGAVVAYEEERPDGVIVRAPDGRRIGVRYHDLRSKGANPKEGVSVTFPGERQE